MHIAKCIGLLVIQIVFNMDCYAREETIDSLKKALPALKDSARIDCLNALSKAYTLFSTDTAQAFASQALPEAEYINYTKGISQAYSNFAWIKWILADDYPEMQIFSKKAIALLQKTTEREQLANSYYLLGLTLWAQSKFSLAIDAYKKAGKFFIMTGDKLNAAGMYAYMAGFEEGRGHYERSLQYSIQWLEVSKKFNNIRYLDVWAELYKNVGDYETALDYYRLAANHAHATRTLDELGWFTQVIGEIYFLQKKYDSANYYYHLALNYNTQSPPPYGRFGELYAALKKYDSALLYLNKDLQNAKKANGRNRIMWNVLRLSNIYKETGDHKKAMQNAQELLQIANETGARQYIRDAHFLLFKLYKSLQKKDSAYTHLQQYIYLKEIIDQDLSVQKLAFYKTKSEAEKAQARIDGLNKEKQLQQIQLRQTVQHKNILFVGIFISILTGILLFRNVLLKRKNERQRLEHELEIQKLESKKTKVEFQKQTTELEMQALRAQMNPHFIFNSLNSINRFILQNDKAKASEYLTKFSRLVRLILQNSAASLIPLESELESLRLYLELEAVRFNHHFEYKIIVDEDLDVDILKVPPLIIQPYAENAIWHGLMHKEEKGHLEIELYQCDEVLCCTITDDGVGRQRAAELKSNSASTHKSMGMRITAGRIAMLQEKKQIDTTIQITDLVLPNGTPGGTEVLLKLPVML